MSKYRYIYEPYKSPASRGVCPACGENDFVHFIDTVTGDRIEAGYCNRKAKCGHEISATEWMKDNETISIERREVKPEELPIDFIPYIQVEQSVGAYEQNYFYQGLKALIGKTDAAYFCKLYNIGSSHIVLWRNATVFWYVDINGNVRQAKAMLYNPETLKRVKDGAEVWVHERSSVLRNACPIETEGQYSKIATQQSCTRFYGRYIMPENKSLNLKPCFFGEHLLRRHPDKPVCIVESEKTAVICAAYFPEFVWLATGGNNGVRWSDVRSFDCLKKRKVVLYPDLGLFDKGKGITNYQKWSERVKLLNTSGLDLRVANYLETNALEYQREKGWDMADLLLQDRDPRLGWAMTDYGYPLMLDLNYAA